MANKSAASGIRWILWALAVAAIPACSGGGGGGGTATRVSLKAEKGQSWVWQNPLPIGNNLYSVSFRNASDGWAVGDGGAIIFTRDSGVTWKAASSPNSKRLWGVSAVSSGTVWAVGDGGVILKSVSEDSFAMLVSGTTQNLNAVAFVSDVKGWAAGDGIILATLDGGATWSPQSIPVQSQSFTSLSFINERTGWATGIAPGVLHTEDGGVTWTAQSGFYNGYFKLTFVDTMHGWAVSGGALVFHSSDGGATWQSQTTPINRFVGSLTSIGFADSQNGWAVGIGGDIIHTSDGGTTWTREAAERLAYSLRSVQVLDAGHAVAVGDYGQILRTSNPGTNWSDPFPGTRSRLNDLAAFDDQQAWAIGNYGSGVLLYTGDGGTHWTLLPNPVPNVLFSIAAYRYPGTSQPVLWATSDKMVLKSTDLGMTWTSKTLPTYQNLWAISFPDPQHGWVAGDGGVVFATTDGGTIWTPQNSGITDDILHLKFVDASVGWLVGSFNRGIVGTKDGGATWTRQVPSQFGIIFDLAAVNEQRAWFVGTFGDPTSCNAPANFAGTADGGATWMFQQVGSPFTHVVSVSFVNAKKGWLLTDDSQIYRTSDGGGTWTFLSIPSTGDFGRVRFASPSVGWVIGGGGAILKSMTEGE
jgi:photosystem II stability/assembly factor-like uncharacterized protein